MGWRKGRVRTMEIEGGLPGSDSYRMAVLLLKAGKRVRRIGWEKAMFLELSEFGTIALWRDGAMVEVGWGGPTIEEAQARDWEVS